MSLRNGELSVSKLEFVGSSLAAAVAYRETLRWVDRRG